MYKIFLWASSKIKYCWRLLYEWFNVHCWWKIWDHILETLYYKWWVISCNSLGWTNSLRSPSEQRIVVNLYMATLIERFIVQILTLIHEDIHMNSLIWFSSSGFRYFHAALHLAWRCWVNTEINSPSSGTAYTEKPRTLTVRLKRSSCLRTVSMMMWSVCLNHMIQTYFTTRIMQHTQHHIFTRRYNY